MIRKIIISVFTAVFFLVSTAFAAVPASLSQDFEFRLDSNRDFGYGSGSDVRGNFSLTIYGDQSKIRSVTYLIDGKEMARLEEAPFRYKYHTSEYASGWHTLTAVVDTVDNRQVTTPPIDLNFLSAEQQAESFQNVIGKILGLAAGLVVLMALAQAFIMRGSKNLAPGTPRNYSFKGGTICPHCGRAYARHIWGINLIGGMLDRCDFCGKWAFVTRRSPAELAAAEQAELDAVRASESAIQINAVGGSNHTSEEERMRKALEDSKYINPGE